MFLFEKRNSYNQLEDNDLNFIYENGIQLFDEKYDNKDIVEALAVYLYGNNDFGSIQMEKLLLVLKKFSNLKKLQFIIGKDNGIDTNSLILLGKYFQSNQSLLYINLSFVENTFSYLAFLINPKYTFGNAIIKGKPNQFNEEGLSYLFESLKSLKQLNTFKIKIVEGIQLSQQSISSLSSTINQLTQLATLCIIIKSNNNLNTEIRYEIGDSLKNIPNLSSLSMWIQNKNFTSEIGIKNMCDNLSKLSQLKDLRLVLDNCNNLTTKSIFMLSICLEQISQLQNLHLSILDEIDPTANQYLYKGISSLKNLTSLYLRLYNDYQLQFISLIQDLKNLIPNSVFFHDKIIMNYTLNEQLNKSNSIDIIVNKLIFQHPHYSFDDDNIQKTYFDFNITSTNIFPIIQGITYLLQGLKALDKTEQLSLVIKQYSVPDVWIQLINDLSENLIHLNQLTIEFKKCQMTRNQINLLGDKFKSLKNLKHLRVVINYDQKVSSPINDNLNQEENQREGSNTQPLSLEEQIKEIQNLESLCLQICDKNKENQTNYSQLALVIKQMKKLNTLEIIINLLQIDSLSIQPLKDSMESIRKLELRINFNQQFCYNSKIGEWLSQSINLQSITLNLNLDKGRVSSFFTQHSYQIKAQISCIFMEISNNLKLMSQLTNFQINIQVNAQKLSQLYGYKLGNKTLENYQKVGPIANFIRNLKRLTLFKVNLIDQ